MVLFLNIYPLTLLYEMKRATLCYSVNKITLPFRRTNFVKNSLSSSGAVLWNSLPCDVREPAKSLSQFKRLAHLNFWFLSIHGNFWRRRWKSTVLASFKHIFINGCLRLTSVSNSFETIEESKVVRFHDINPRRGWGGGVLSYTSKSWHYSYPSSVYCRSIVFVLVV